jgi:hypothetical protein
MGENGKAGRWGIQVVDKSAGRGTGMRVRIHLGGWRARSIDSDGMGGGGRAAGFLEGSGAP